MISSFALLSEDPEIAAVTGVIGRPPSGHIRYVRFDAVASTEDTSLCSLTGSVKSFGLNCFGEVEQAEHCCR